MFQLAPFFHHQTSEVSRLAAITSIAVALILNPFAIASAIGAPDVIVTSLSYDNGVFTSTVKNQGTTATPAGVAIGVGYWVDGIYKTWGGAYEPLAAGDSVTIGTEGGSFTIPDGAHTIMAWVDDNNRFAESNESNNKFSQSITVGGITSTQVPATTTLSCALHPTSSLVVNVNNTGAMGNDSDNDTAAIQAAIDRVGGTGGTVLVPDGTYLIDAVTHLNLKSNMTLKMTSGAVLKAIPNDKNNFSVIKILNASNVNVIGGTVQGERDQHNGTTGEWGHGIEVDASNNVVIEGVTSKNNWGDGFFVGYVTQDSKFCSVTADNNRRTGMAITSGDNLVVQDSVFKNTSNGGTLPQYGLNIEPNIGQTVSNVEILSSQFLHNEGGGIQSSVPNALAGQAWTKNVTIDGNTLSNNGVIGYYSAGILVTEQSGGAITNNTVSWNVQDGIVLTNYSSNHTVSGNTVKGNGNSVNTNNGNGILLYNGSTYNTVTNNTVTGNRHNIANWAGASNQISNNTIN